MININLKRDKDICSKAGREILEEILGRAIEERELTDGFYKRLKEFLVKEGWLKGEVS